MSKVVKNNIRSFRYSDEVADILEGMEGASLNEKFENLVRTCYLRLPAVQGQIEMYDRLLESSRKKYFDRFAIEKEMDIVVRSVGELQEKIDYIRGKLDKVCNTL